MRLIILKEAVSTKETDSQVKEKALPTNQCGCHLKKDLQQVILKEYSMYK